MTNVATLQTVADLSASQTAASPSALMPTGTVLHFAGSSAPTGWLLCDGSAVSRTTYATLFALISTTYGAGDGSTTFNVPNTSGIFISGVGTQTISSISYSRTLATKQGDQFQGHTHTVNYHSGTATPTGANAFQLDLNVTSTTNVDVPTTIGANGSPRYGTETRPANIALNHIIKI